MRFASRRSQSISKVLIKEKDPRKGKREARVRRWE